MLIKTEINRVFKEIELHVCNSEENDNVKSIVRELHEIYDQKLSGVDERGNRCLLKPGEIISAYAEGQKVMVLGPEGVYTVSKKLYELENELGNRHFVRISKSEIVNIRKISKLDMSITGTIKLIMRNGYETYVSRRNIQKIKDRLIDEK